jgi:hypothetical protein
MLRMMDKSLKSLRRSPTDKYQSLNIKQVLPKESLGQIPNTQTMQILPVLNFGFVIYLEFANGYLGHHIKFLRNISE